MANLQTSMEYSAIHNPDVMEAFQTVVAKMPSFLGIIPIETRPEFYATNHKHEWLEHSQQQRSWTVDGQSNAASATVTLDDNTGVQVGDVLKFVKPTGGSHTVKAKVTAVDGGGADLTVTRLGTDEAILDNSVAYLVSRAKAELSGESLGTNVTPSRVFNYTQIFREDFALSRTLLQTHVYGLANEASRQNKIHDMIDFQAEAKLRDIAWQLNLSALEGVKELRVDGGANGAMGGVLGFVEDASAQYDASSSDISPTILNAAIEQAIAAGGIGADMQVILCHSRQARKISAFNAVGNNPIVQRGDITAGNYVAQYQSDLARNNGGSLATIVVDRNFPEDKALIFNPSKLKIVPMQPLGYEETSDPKDDGRTWKMLGELTLEVHDAASQFVLVENLGL